jgi:quercetin dioxygenase-like cupin family protein
MSQKYKMNNVADLPAHNLMPGGEVRFIHTDSMTLAYWTFEEGAVLKDHSHPHEQVVNLLEGELEFTLGGEVSLLVPGSAIVCPPGIPHSGKALKPTRVLDVFCPVREDFLALDRETN